VILAACAPVQPLADRPPARVAGTFELLSQNWAPLNAIHEQAIASFQEKYPEAQLVGRRLEAEAQRGGLQDVDEKDRVWQLTGVTRHVPAIMELACNPKLLNILETLLGTPDIKLYSDQVLMKPPFHGSPVSWHQDSGYWTAIWPPALVSCWVSLDEATLENGCVHMVPGSHKLGVVPHERGDDQFLHVRGLDLSTAIPVVLPPGGVSFHHSCTVHGSGPNRTEKRRRGLVLSYMRADSRWLGDPDRKPHFPLLQGREYPGCV
jgi:ectoine hydroxylase-related dioxygenase (phytanoyl-CoA dioxygenase family)